MTLSRVLSRVLCVVALIAVAGTAAAQQRLYKWVDEKGKVHVTDTPPPPSVAKKVEERTFSGSTVQAPTPYELEQAQKRYPVTLYSSPSCKDACAMARKLLNERGIPFTEVQVWDEQTNAQLKKVSGSNEVPVLTVGSTVQKGFEQGAYNTLLDSAGYPAAGVLPARTQAAPAAPAGYVPPSAKPEAPAAPITAKPIAPKPPPPSGPYSPASTTTKR